MESVLNFTNGHEKKCVPKVEKSFLCPDLLTLDIAKENEQ